jgi:hypothetical protein
MAAVACVRPNCENSILTETNSPDQQLVAAVFERGCGATTPFVQAVSLRKWGSPFDGDAQDSVVFTMKGRAQVRVAWLADKRLVITRPEARSDIFKELTVWEDVTVAYEP